MFIENLSNRLSALNITMVDIFRRVQLLLLLTMSAENLFSLWLLLMVVLLMMLLLMLMMKLMLMLELELLVLMLLLMLLLLLLMMLLHSSSHPLPHLNASSRHGGEREGHGGQNGSAELGLLHAAGLRNEDGLTGHGHAAHHGHGGEAGPGHAGGSHADLRHAELVVVVALGRSWRNGLDCLGLVHPRGFRRGRC